MGKKSLFDDGEEFPEQPELRVNADFAKRFEVSRPQASPAHVSRHTRPALQLPWPDCSFWLQYNERRKDLERLKVKYPDEAAKMEARALREAGGSGQEDEDTSDDEDEVIAVWHHVPVEH